MSSSPTDVKVDRKTDGYYCEAPADPCVIVMFGASGDLARRKLLPSLYDLALHDCLAPRFRLVGFARTEMTDDKFRETASESLRKARETGGGDPKVLGFLKKRSSLRG